MGPDSGRRVSAVLRMTSPLLEARDLSFDYPGAPEGIRALRGIDLDLERGELAIAIGPNGSGKSTLIKVLAGLLAPTSGRVMLDGRPLSSLSPRERARAIAVVPQFLPALPEVRVEEFVLGGRYARLDRWKRITAGDRRIVDDALSECDAGELAERGMNELSGGQRQRALVARALAQEPRVLLVDEPTNALDPEHQIRTFDLVARLRSGDRSALVVTHDLSLASQYATRLLLLERGAIAAQGDVEHVLRREVLEPVYGANLYFGRWPSEGTRADAGRPFVLPRRADSLNPR
jgi:iron complex transport system ATP-binding protein